MSDIYSIEIREYQKTGMNGDRASHSNTPYSDYEVWVTRLDGETAHIMKMRTVSGYDSWWSHVRNKQTVLQELGEFVEELSAFFGVESPMHKKFKKETEVIDRWVEIENESDD